MINKLVHIYTRKNTVKILFILSQIKFISTPKNSYCVLGGPRGSRGDTDLSGCLFCATVGLAPGGNNFGCWKCPARGSRARGRCRLRDVGTSPLGKI